MTDTPNVGNRSENGVMPGDDLPVLSIFSGGVQTCATLHFSIEIDKKKERYGRMSA